MEATKKQRFLYSIWVCLLAAYAAGRFLFATVFEYLLVLELLVCADIVVLFAWLIPAFTAADRRAWGRFGMVAAFEVPIAVATLVCDYDGFSSAAYGVAIFHCVLIAVYAVWALRLRKEIIEKSAAAKAGAKAGRNTADSWPNPSGPVSLREAVTGPAARTAASDAVKNAAKPENKAKKTEVTHETITAGRGLNPAPAAQEPLQTETPEHTILDINRCGEEDFLTLPGMSLASAKRAVESREDQGPYQSVDDFVARNGIKPHFMMQMLPRITVRAQKKETPPTKRGRVLDL